MNRYPEAKKLFLNYVGRVGFMVNDGVYDNYKMYNIPKEVEDEWLSEYKEELIERLKETEYLKFDREAVIHLTYLIEIDDFKIMSYMLKYIVSVFNIEQDSDKKISPTVHLLDMLLTPKNPTYKSDLSIGLLLLKSIGFEMRINSNMQTSIGQEAFRGLTAKVIKVQSKLDDLLRQE